MAMDIDVWCLRRRMILQSVFILAVCCLGHLASGCSPPEPVEGLVQFINAVDVATRTDVTYPLGTIVTAQCREPGVKELRGNTNGQTCQQSGTWSGQPPSCTRDFEGKLTVVGGVSQQVTEDGRLLVYTSAVNSTVEVRCSLKGRSPQQTGTPQLEASHIHVDNARVQQLVDENGQGTRRDSFIRLSPAEGGDSGLFECFKFRSPIVNRLSIRFRAERSLSAGILNGPSCPDNIVQETDPGLQDAAVNWTQPISDEQLQTAIGADQTFTFNATHEPGARFPIGDTEVVYTVSRDGNEVEGCRFTVTIIDTEVPQFVKQRCPHDTTRQADPGLDTTAVTWEPVSAFDNTLLVTISSVGDVKSGDKFEVGRTDVSYVAEDPSGNTNYCNFTITIIDIEPPTIHNCPGSLSASIIDVQMSKTRVYWNEPNVTDNTNKFSLAPTHMPGDFFDYGETDVKYIARDMSNNENHCNFKVTVYDRVPPKFFDCPLGQTAYLTGNATTVPVTWQRLVAWDNIDIVGPTVSTHEQGQQFGVGTHLVMYTALDQAGNNGTCAFNVTVEIAQCQSEVTPYEEGILTWPAARPTNLVPSLQRCSVYTENAGSIRAVRVCNPDDLLGAIWLEPVLKDCGNVRDSIDLDDLTNVEVGEGNVMEVSQVVAMTVLNMTSVADHLDPVANILEHIVKAGSPSVEVTKAVIQTVDVVISSVSDRDTALTDEEGSVSSDDAPRNRSTASSSIVRSLESQITLVSSNVTDLRVSLPSLAVNVVTLKTYGNEEETQFLSVLNEVDPDSSTLHDGGVHTMPKGVRGDSEGMSWPVDTAITLPSNIGEESSKRLLGNPLSVSVSFVLYQTDGLFDSPNVSRMLTVGNPGEYVTSGRVISSTIEGVQLMNLSEPVVVEFTPHQEWNDTIGLAQCVYWDFNLDNGTGDWSTDGCEYVGFEDGRIKCNCYHLTNFAVIMSMKDMELSPAAIFILDFISAAGLALSIAGVSLTLFTFLVFGNLRATRSRQILMQLCLALLCLYVVFLTGIDAVYHDVICMAVAAAIHYLVLASMFWMGVEARNMYLLLVRVFKGRESKFMSKACFFAWGVPLVIVAITFGVAYPMNMYRHQDFCFLYIGLAQYLGLLLPIGLVLIHNVVTFVLVVRSLINSDMRGNANKKKKTQMQKLSCRLQNAICMSVLLGLSWGFGFLSITFGSFIYQLIFCVANSFQGFLVFILFCVRSADVRKAWRNAMPIECNLRGQTYKIQERSRTNVFAVDGWVGSSKLSDADGPGLDVYMYTSYSGDGSSRWDDSKYISYTSQMSNMTNTNSIHRPFSIYSSENGTVGRKK
ncbi:uncharacterized protein [Asterias amurensis]|uniref:uncharacterized protein n=1 Tax=Asterias amurensis TaxID=7602 RepID=UPI003AB1F594